MNGGVKFLACSALLAISACTGEDGKLEVRAIPTPLAPGAKPVSFRVAEGHQQMSLGNVALALESYRKALRDDPNSVDAHAGLAAGYDRMGRYDLARRNYEAALAISPGNATVLAMLAASLEQQGKKAEALAIRDEVQQRMAAARLPAAIEQGDQVATVETRVPVPDLKVPPVQLASTPITSTSMAIAPAPVVAEFEPDVPVVVPAARMAEAQPTEIRVTRPALVPAPVKLAEAAPARSVTIVLPKPIPVAKPVEKLAEPTVTLPISRPTPAPAPPPAPPPIVSEMAALAPQPKPSLPSAALPVATGRGPTLQRTSLGEVALITNNAPKWASLLVKQEPRSATVRFVPLKQANARFASVRLLNAARVQGLAAQTRSTLFDRGWRSMAIGDAKATRARSLVLYPAHRRATALSLARQFGFAAVERATGREITVLLGRDAALMARRLPAA